MVKNKQPIIKLEQVNKTYNEYGVTVRAIDNISLEIYPGELVAITGPSGSGKSTLLHCIGLLDRPSSGIVYIEGKNTSEISGKEVSLFRGRKLGFVFQHYNLIPRLTSLENVMLPGLILGRDDVDVKKKAHILLKEVGIDHRTHHKGVHLSGGEQQKVAIARALINNPVIVLADEPTGALDTENSRDIMKLLVKMNKKRNTTFIFISHETDIAQYGKRRIILKDGSIVDDTYINSSNNIRKKRKQQLTKTREQRRSSQV